MMNGDLGGSGRLEICEYRRAFVGVSLPNVQVLVA